MSATNLGNMFKLLSVASECPTAEFADVLASGTFASDVRSVWAALELPAAEAESFCRELGRYEGVAADRLLHEIRRDWTHLFLGEPPLVDGSEGMWRQRAVGKLAPVRMINAYSVAVADFMRDCGVKRQAGFNDCIDNIEQELDFCAFLANDPDYLRELGRDPQDLLQRFVDEHLAKWVPGFCADVEEHARTSYYRALSQLLAAFVSAL